MQIPDIQNHIAGSFCGLINIKADIAPDHHAGKLALGHSVHIHGGDVLAETDDSAEVRGLLNFLELVRNENDALSVAGEVMHDVDKLDYLLRSERGGGLIKNEYIRAAVESLEDLDALLHTDGDIFYLCVGVDRKAVAFGDLNDIAARGFHIESRPLFRFGAEDDILRDGKGLDEHEVLMHHADAGIDSVARRIHLDFLAVYENVARGGLEHTVKLVHQR